MQLQSKFNKIQKLNSLCVSVHRYVQLFLTMIYAINIYEKIGRGETRERSPNAKELHDNFAKTCTYTGTEKM